MFATLLGVGMNPVNQLRALRLPHHNPAKSRLLPELDNNSRLYITDLGYACNWLRLLQLALMQEVMCNITTCAFVPVVAGPFHLLEGSFCGDHFRRYLNGQRSAIYSPLMSTANARWVAGLFTRDGLLKKG